MDIQLPEEVQQLMTMFEELKKRDPEQLAVLEEELAAALTEYKETVESILARKASQ